MSSTKVCILKYYAGIYWIDINPLISFKVFEVVTRTVFFYTGLWLRDVFEQFFREFLWVFGWNMASTDLLVTHYLLRKPKLLLINLQNGTPPFLVRKTIDSSSRQTLLSHEPILSRKHPIFFYPPTHLSILSRSHLLLKLLLTMLTYPQHSILLFDLPLNRLNNLAGLVVMQSLKIMARREPIERIPNHSTLTHHVQHLSIFISGYLPLTTRFQLIQSHHPFFQLHTLMPRHLSIHIRRSNTRPECQIFQLHLFQRPHIHNLTLLTILLNLNSWS